MLNNVSSLINKELSFFEENPVIHLRQFITKEIASTILDVIQRLSYEENIHEGKVVRYEIPISETEFDFIKPIRKVLEGFAERLNYHDGYSYEYFVFKYQKGHFIPEHQDNMRHKILFMIYIGEFEGGNYLYKLDDSIHNVDIKSCDAVISINELGEGRWQNPLHSVQEITEGVRFTIAGSIVLN